METNNLHAKFGANRSVNGGGDSGQTYGQTYRQQIQIIYDVKWNTNC